MHSLLRLLNHLSPLPSIHTELAAADEAAASPSAPATLTTLTGAATDLRKRLAAAGATLSRVEARVKRIEAAAVGGASAATGGNEER